MTRVLNSATTFMYRYDNYNIEIIADYNEYAEYEYEVWLYRDSYGVKAFMYGLIRTDLDTVVDIVEKSLPLYIERYERRFCSE